MKITVNDKYKLIAAPKICEGWIGTVFVVSNVSGNIIDLKQDAEYGRAYISVTLEEFPQYFKLEETETTKPKRCRAGKWSEWKTFDLYGVTYAYKENGKNVVVRSNGCRGESKCHPEDEFDLNYGLRLAVSRLVQNKQKRQKSIEDIKRQQKKETDATKRTSINFTDEWWYLL